MSLRRILTPFALAGALAAQTPPQPEPPQPTPGAEVPSSTLVAQLKATDVALAPATALVELLPGRPVVVRLQAADALRAQYLARADRFTRAVEVVKKQMAKALPALQKDKLGRGGDQKLVELRARSLAVTHRADLSKDMIHDEIDPVVAELREALLPTVEQLTAAVPPVADAIAALRASHQDLKPWFDLYWTSLGEFDLNEDVNRYLKKKPPPDAPLAAERVEAALADWLFQNLPMSARDQHVLLDNEALRTTTDTEDFAGTYELNRRRYLLGLPLLRIDPKLGAAAHDHSDDMRRLDFFSHTSPVDGKHTFADRAARFGTSASAENIAAGHGTGPSAIDGWWYSPGHHKNMLGGHGRTGLGHSETMWTQMFGG